MTVLVQHEHDPATVARSSAPRLLLLAALALVATHWLRLLPLGFPAPGQTRYEDFVDLLTPYAIAGPALAALAQAERDRRTWTLALLGTALFVQGHGLHLSANSISFARGPAAPTYLWDEQISHHLWFLGLALLVAVVVPRIQLDAERSSAPALAVAVAVGVTWAANVVEGGVVPLGAALATGLVVLGWRRRDRLTGRVLMVAFGLSLLLLAAYGAWQTGFPQPSELGWL